LSPFSIIENRDTNDEVVVEDTVETMVNEDVNRTVLRSSLVPDLVSETVHPLPLLENKTLLENKLSIKSPINDAKINEIIPDSPLFENKSSISSFIQKMKTIMNSNKGSVFKCSMIPWVITLIILSALTTILISRHTWKGHATNLENELSLLKQEKETWKIIEIDYRNTQSKLHHDISNIQQQLQTTK